MTGITPDQFKEFVGTGATDDEVGRWLRERSKLQDKLAMIRRTCEQAMSHADADG